MRYDGICYENKCARIILLIFDFYKFGIYQDNFLNKLSLFHYQQYLWADTIITIFKSAKCSVDGIIHGSDQNGNKE